MFKSRDNVRYTGHAYAIISGVVEDKIPLKNFSITGCCIETAIHIDISLYNTYSIEIIPEKESKVKNFAVSAEARWVQAVGNIQYVGFYFTASPKGKLFERFVDYVSWLPIACSASSDAIQDDSASSADDPAMK